MKHRHRIIVIDEETNTVCMNKTIPTATVSVNADIEHIDGPRAGQVARGWGTTIEFYEQNKNFEKEYRIATGQEAGDGR